MLQYEDTTKNIKDFESASFGEEMRRPAKTRPNVVTFYSTGKPYGFLSNWYPSPFEFCGHTFPTAEHWMMWQKAQLFGDQRKAAAILRATDLNEVKGLGRQVEPYVEAAWEEVRLPVMRVGLRQKFLQNEQLLNDLLSTGMAAIAEAAPNDRIWGIGIGVDDPKANDPGQWRGRNLLGRVLMEVRSDLRSIGAASRRASWSHEDLIRSQFWNMSLLELARVPSTRPAALMYATFVAQAIPRFRDAHDVLREVRATIGDIDESMRLNMSGGLPVAGWLELLDELAVCVQLENIVTRPGKQATDTEDSVATFPRISSDVVGPDASVEDRYWAKRHRREGGGRPAPTRFFDADDLAFLTEAAESVDADRGEAMSPEQEDVAQLASLVLACDFDTFGSSLEDGAALDRRCRDDEDYRRVVMLGLEFGVACAHGGCANYLGALYYMGNVVRQDYGRAKELYEVADELGNMQATVNLGYIYEYGRCGAPDYDAAYRQYAKAAALSGHYEALYKLGDMYARGHGAKRDLRTALSLYDRSLGEAEGIASQCQPAFRIAELVSDPEGAKQGMPYDPMGALGLYQLAERGLRVEVAHGQVHYMRRLREAIDGQDRMRKVLDDPDFLNPHREDKHSATNVSDNGASGSEEKGENMTDVNKKATKLADAVWGAAVGDALGVPYEFKNRDSFECKGMVGHGTHNQPAGTWSDDTALMLATCDSIRVVGRVDTGDLLARFRRWYNDGEYAPDGVVFDVGIATSQALQTGKGLDGEWDNGNGSLMRIAPLAFCGASDEEVRAASAVTHAHKTSTEACVEFVHLLRDAVADPEGTRERLRSELKGVPRDEVSSGGYVLDTLHAAKWCFANTDNYRDCVLAAVNLGRDTDTTACVAGALAGAAYGIDAIPQEWLEAMRGREVLEATLF